MVTEGTGFQPQQFPLNVPPRSHRLNIFTGWPRTFNCPSVLPEFLQLYLRDEADFYASYEPLRMAVQLYDGLFGSLLEGQARSLVVSR